MSVYRRRLLSLAVVFASLAGLTAARAATTATAWSEGFEGDPSTRGVTTTQDAAPLSSRKTGTLTAWNLIDTSKTTTLLTWAGPYEANNFYNAGLNRGTNVINGLAYTKSADTSLLISGKPVPSDQGYLHAELSFAIAGASSDGADFLTVEVRKSGDPGWSTIASYTGSNDIDWATHSADMTSYLGQTVDVRFHFKSDDARASTDQVGGWNVDAVSLIESDQLSAPEAPRGLTVTSSSDTALSLTWSAPASDGGSPVTSYTLYRANTSGDLGTAIVSTPATSYTDTAVTTGNTYYYTVTATNTVGEGARSAETSATAAAPIAPTAPLGLSASSTSSAIALSWSPPASSGGAAITSYNVYRGTSPGAEALLAASGAVPVYTDTTAVTGQTYYYTVSAVNSVGEGPQSAEASAARSNVLAFTNFAGPTAMADNAGEPTLGVNWNTGNILMTSGWDPTTTFQRIARITVGDPANAGSAVWTDVTPPFMVINADPIMNMDAATGHTLAGGDDLACTVLAQTDDDGASWLPVGNSCPIAADHPTVGQGIASQSAPTKPATDLLAHPVYVCQQQSADVCVVSFDGGDTFVPGGLVRCQVVNPGVSGHLRVGPDGTAYLPFDLCSNTAQGVASNDTNGLTPWVGHPISGITPGTGAANDPSLAPGAGDKFAGGRLYFAATDGTSHHAVVSTSTDHAQNWTTALDLNVASARVSGDAVGVRSAVFATAIAGDDDRAAIAFLGTKDAGDAFGSTFAGTWHLYVAMTYDGGNTWTTIDATPTDPVQRGWICVSGIGCPLSGAGRNLLDFMDIVVDAQGRVIVGYADGCIAACAGPSGIPAQSTHSVATIAYQASGTCLFASKC